MPAELLNTPTFESWMRDAFLEQIYDRLQAEKGNLEGKVRTLIQPFLLSSPEYNSLLDGKLRTSFGISDSKTALDEITNAVLDSTFTVVKQGTNFVSCTVNILKDSFEEVLSLPNVSYVYQARAKTIPGGRRLLGGQVEIPWLQWLLFKGSSIFITDSQVATVNVTPYSRTGSTVMIQTKNPKGFGVPAEFSGVEDSNWLTRTLQPIQDDIIEQIYSIIK